MRFRGKSIRRKIVALLLVPLVSLTGIWGFATVLTGREVNQLFDTTFIVQEIGYPTEDVISVLQDERRQTLVYLADPRASDALTDLRRTRTATDEVVSKIRGNARDADVRDEMGSDTTERLTAILDAFDGVGSLRQSVEDNTVTRAQALDLYNRLVDPCYILLANLQVLDNVDVDKEGRALVNMSRARELLAREDALLGSALVVGKVSRDEARDISDLVAQRTIVYEINLPQLPAAERVRYEHYWKNAATAPLRVAEQSALASAPGAPRGVTAKSWDGLADDVLDGLDKFNTQASDRFQDRVRPVAVGVIVKAAIAGVLGLAAVLISLFMSVRIGRSLIRDLRRLRQEAHETAGCPAAQRDAPPLRGRTGRRRDRGPAPGVREERDRRGQPGAQQPPAFRRRGRRQAVRTAQRCLRGLREPRAPQPGPAAQAAHAPGHDGTQDRGHRRTRRPLPPRPPDDPYAPATRKAW